MATIGAVLVVLAVSVAQIVQADRICSGEFTYATDEAYVHLSLARRMALQPPSEEQPWPAASALAESASPAWTALLAGVVKLSGSPASTEDPGQHPWVELLAPLILNLALAGLLIMLVGHLLRFDVRRSIGFLGRLLAVAACMAMPLMVLTGTEHLAHAFVLLLAVSAGVELIERERVAAWRLLWASVWMGLAVGLRYESLGVLAGLVLWAWIRRRVRRVILPAMAGLAVAVGIAVYLVTHGQPWLPAPVWTRLLGGASPSADWAVAAVDRAVENIRVAMLPAALVLIAAVMLWSRREQQSSPDADDRVRVGWLFVFLVAGVMHLLIARAGEHYRYTAYVVPLGAVAVFRALASRPGAKWSPSAPVGLRYAVMAVFCLLPLAVAAVPVIRAQWYAPQASRRVYLTNRLMATFVRTYFPEATVAANEVGALRYETAARVLDWPAVSLQDDAVAEAARTQIALRVSGAEAGIRMPSSWGAAGGWRVAEGCAGCEVTLLAPPGAYATRLRQALQVFDQQQRPAGVEVWYEGSAPDRPSATRPVEAVTDREP